MSSSGIVNHSVMGFHITSEGFVLLCIPDVQTKKKQKKGFNQMKLIYIIMVGFFSGLWLSQWVNCNEIRLEDQQIISQRRPLLSPRCGRKDGLRFSTPAAERMNG